MKASDNTYPRLQLSTGVATTAPTGGLWELRARADGLYAVSSNTGSAGTGPLGSGGGALTDHSHKVTGSGSTGGGLLAAIGCIVSGISTALASGAYTSLAFANADTFDSDAFHDPASNNTRLTIPAGKGGVYRLTGYMTWPSSGSANTDRRVGYRVNGGGDVTLERDTYSVTSTAMFRGFAWTLSLAAGDYIELRQYTGIASTTSGDYWAQLFLVGV